MDLSKFKAPLRVELSCSVHATESEEKVLKSLRNILPEHLREAGKIQILSSKVRGHYGNPITIISASITGPEAQEIVNYLFSNLSAEDKAYLSTTMDARVDSGRLYLRINKQKAFTGLIKLSEGDDVIRVVITFSRRK